MAVSGHDLEPMRALIRLAGLDPDRPITRIVVEMAVGEVAVATVTELVEDRGQFDPCGERRDTTYRLLAIPDEESPR